MSNNSDARTWNMLCHLAALAGFTAIPLASILGPFIVWILKKNEIPSVDAHGKASLNFQISMLIYMIVAGFLCLILIGYLLLPIIVITDLVCVIIASIKASNDEPFTYPFSLELIK